MMTSNPIRRIGIASITVALLTSSALAVGALQINTALADEAGAVSQVAVSASGTDVPVYPAETDPVPGEAVTVEITGTYHTSSAEALLGRVNEIRAEAAAEGITVDGVVVSGSALEWSTDLESAAQIRSVEASVFASWNFENSHDRPRGSGTIYGFSDSYSQLILDENLGWASNAADALEEWYAEKDAYVAYLAGDTSIDPSSFARYKSLITDTVYAEDGNVYTIVYIGMGCFTATGLESGASTTEGDTALAALFSAAPSTGSLPVRSDGECIQEINVYADGYLTAEITGPSEFPANGTAQLTASVVSDKNHFEGDVSWYNWLLGDLTDGVDYTWKSSNPDVATVDENGLVTGVAPGTTTISIKSNGVILARYQLTVTEAEPVIESIEDPGTITTDSGTAPVLPATLTATWDTGETTTEDVVWDAVDPAEYQVREGGSFDVTGTVSDWRDTHTVTVHVVVNAAEPVSATVPAVEPEPAGIAPELPATVEITWSNGDTTEETMVWDAIDPDAYVTPGTFSVEGVAGDTGFTATCTVTVEEPVVVGVDTAVDVVTDSGTAPLLPQTVTATMSDGSMTELTVTWDTVAPASYTSREGGTFSISGTVEGWDEAATAQITVEPAVITEAEAPAAVTTPSGTAPDLPATTEVTWSNGDSTDETVSWDAIEPDEYSTREGGSFSVSGTVEGWDAPIAIEVTVEAATITAVSEPATVTTPSGTAPDLPATTEVTWSNGDTTDETVSWDAIEPDEYSAREGGSFEVEGTVEDWDAPVTVEVTVEAATITNVEAPSAVTTPSGTAPDLPTTAEVTWSNGDTTDEAVSWDAIEPSEYSAREGGSFEVEGTVEGWDAPIAVEVTVDAATITNVEAPAAITTPSGTAPDLPATTEVTWSNGDTTDEVISWDAIEPDEYSVREGGSFEVEGTVEGWDGTLTADITVDPATVETVTAPEPISIIADTTPDLPTTTEVTWSNGDVTEEPIAWENTDDAFNAPGTVTVEGTVGDTDTTVSCTVTVEAPSIEQADEPKATITIPSGTTPELPETVEITWNNGNTTDEAVTWDPIDESVYSSREGGTFEVTGILTDTGDTVTAEVTVEPATIEPINEPLSVSTESGSVPELPETVEVTWSNGDVSEEPITWETIDPSAFDEAGTVTIEGTVGDSDIQVSCTVTVEEPATQPEDEGLTGSDTTSTAPGAVIPGSITPEGTTPEPGTTTPEGTTSEPGGATSGTTTPEESTPESGTTTPEGTTPSGEQGEGSTTSTEPAATGSTTSGEEPTEGTTPESGTTTPEPGATTEGSTSEPGTTSTEGTIPGSGSTTEGTTPEPGTKTEGTTPKPEGTVSGGTASEGTGSGSTTTEPETTEPGGTESGETTPGATGETTPGTTGEATPGAMGETIPGATGTSGTPATGGSTTSEPGAPEGTTSGSTTGGATTTEPGTSGTAGAESGTSGTTTTEPDTSGIAGAESGNIPAEGTTPGSTSTEPGGTATGPETTEPSGTATEPEETTPEVPEITPVSAEAVADITIVAGTTPDLPTTTEVTWSDDSVTEESITWEDADTAVFDTPGTVTVEGAVGDTDLTVSCTVMVEAPTLENPDEPQVVVTVPSGTEPDLPQTVEVTWNNGTTTEEPVTWEPVDESTFSSREGGTIDVMGTLTDSDITVMAEVTVDPATITDVEAPGAVTTPSGTAPDLPSTTEVTWSNGDTTDEAVTWDAIDPDEYSAREGGSFEVEGTVEDWDAPITVEVTVDPATITDVEAPAAVTTPSGTAPDLPSTTEVTWSNGDTTNEAVSWDAIDPSEYSAREGGSFEVEGTVEDWAAPIAVEVTVEAADITAVEAPQDVDTVELVSPALPETVEVTWSNGDVTDENVTWDAVDEAAYSEPGSFTVTGTVDGWDGSVSCTVIVEAATITGVEQPAGVDTPAGTAPVLPETVEVTLNNGTVTEEPITWEAVPASTYHDGGSFTVSGTVGETGETVDITVTVEPATPVEATAITLSTPAGIAPDLPETAQVTWSNGDVTDEAVTWDTVSPSSYAETGEFTADASFANSAVDLDLTATVTVTAPIIETVAAPEDIDITAGTKLTLPKSITVTMSDGTEEDRTVTWESVDSDSYANEGTFTVTGTVEGTNDIITATVNVGSPAALWIHSIYVTTDVGVPVELPETARFTWSNNTVTDEAVTWEDVDASLFDEAGTYVVSGTAAGHTVKATITVGAEETTSTNVAPIIVTVVIIVVVIAIIIAAVVHHRRRTTKDEESTDTGK